MLLVAQRFEKELRGVGIDPEAIEEMELVMSGPHAGELAVRFRPRVEYVRIDIVRVKDDPPKDTPF